MKFANTYTITEINNEKYKEYREEFNKSLDLVIEKMVNNIYDKPKSKIIIKNK